MVCPEGCGRGSARAWSAAMGHPRLLAGGTKEEEKGEEDVAVLGLKETGGGKTNGLCQLPVSSCPPQEALAGPGSQRLWQRASFSS